MARGIKAGLALALFCLALFPREALAAWQVVSWRGEGLPFGFERWYRPVELEHEAWGLPAASPDRAAVREEIARLEAAWPELELTVYLVSAAVKSGGCGPYEFVTGLYLPDAKAVALFALPKLLAAEETYDLIYAAAARHEVGHAVWFQLMSVEEREAWAREKGFGLEEAAEEWARKFERESRPPAPAIYKTRRD